MYCQRMRSPYRWSPSSRRAWIEIFLVGGFRLLLSVALLAEGVDRNMEYYEKLHEKYRVALLAEGGDRNKYSPRTLSHARVALLAEGVDRNLSVISQPSSLTPSPSSRRAWIEIMMPAKQVRTGYGRPPRGGRG